MKQSGISILQQFIQQRQAERAQSRFTDYSYPASVLFSSTAEAWFRFTPSHYRANPPAMSVPQEHREGIESDAFNRWINTYNQTKVIISVQLCSFWFSSTSREEHRTSTWPPYLTCAGLHFLPLLFTDNEHRSWLHAGRPLSFSVVFLSLNQQPLCN